MTKSSLEQLVSQVEKLCQERERGKFGSRLGVPGLRDGGDLPQRFESNYSICSRNTELHNHISTLAFKGIRNGHCDGATLTVLLGKVSMQRYYLAATDRFDCEINVLGNDTHNAAHCSSKGFTDIFQLFYKGKRSLGRFCNARHGRCIMVSPKTECIDSRLRSPCSCDKSRNVALYTTVLSICQKKQSAHGIALTSLLHNSNTTVQTCCDVGSPTCYKAHCGLPCCILPNIGHTH